MRETLKGPEEPKERGARCPRDRLWFQPAGEMPKAAVRASL